MWIQRNNNDPTTTSTRSAQHNSSNNATLSTAQLRSSSPPHSFHTAALGRSISSLRVAEAVLYFVRPPPPSPAHALLSAIRCSKAAQAKRSVAPFLSTSTSQPPTVSFFRSLLCISRPNAINTQRKNRFAILIMVTGISAPMQMHASSRPCPRSYSCRCACICLRMQLQAAHKHRYRTQLHLCSYYSMCDVCERACLAGGHVRGYPMRVNPTGFSQHHSPWRRTVRAPALERREGRKQRERRK